MLKITDVKPEGGLKIKITYSNSRAIMIDLTSRVKKGGVFAPLVDPTFFDQVKIGRNGRFLEWPGEIDLCADALWFEGTGEIFSIEESKAS